MLPYLARYPTEFQRWLFLVTHYLDKFSLDCDCNKTLLKPNERISLAACSTKLKIKTTHTLFD